MILFLLQLAAGPPCPSAEEVRAVPPGATIPREWIRAFLSEDCPGPAWEFGMRLRKDSATTARIARVLREKALDSTLISPRYSWLALKWVSEAGPATSLDIMLRYSAHSPSTYDEELRSGGTFEFALSGLVRYAPTSSAARRRIEKHLHSDNPNVRQVALYVLLHVNNAWSRALAAGVPERDLIFHDRLLRAAVLAGPPCPPGTFWSECHGVEGQVYRQCEPWPLPCGIDKYGA